MMSLPRKNSGKSLVDLENYDPDFDNPLLTTRSKNKGSKGAMYFADKELIGTGKSGSIIIKAVHNTSKLEVACKIISKKGKTMSQVDRIRNQVKMYEMAQHANVVRLEDYFENKEHIFLCLELHSGVTLYDYVLKN